MSEEKSFDLTKVHEVNLKLLKEIDRICRKYKIKYALDSGTLLGAVRHGGFIPWDDDVDVMFTRKNYVKFYVHTGYSCLLQESLFHQGKAVNLEMELQRLRRPRYLQEFQQE